MKRNAGNLINEGYEASKTGVNKMLVWTGIKKEEQKEEEVE